MKIISTIKQLVSFTPMLVQFNLDKVYYRRDRHMYGSLHLKANKKVDIVAVEVIVQETLKITKETSESTILGNKIFREQFTLQRFEKWSIDFDFLLKFPRGTKRERQTYKGDMGPLNKATDKAKKQLYTYTIIARIKLKGKKEPYVYEEKILVE